MCNAAIIEFVRNSLAASDIEGRRILEVGSRDVCGSVRPEIVKNAPAEYVGVDIESGPGVDLIVNAENLENYFGTHAFDIVISAEMVEHTRDWRRVFSGMKRVLRPRGTLIVTTRSKGFGYHAYPHDYWRYETSDMHAIFNDMEVEAIETDPFVPGVFVRTRKPPAFKETDLRELRLWSIVGKRRMRDLSDLEWNVFRAVRPVWRKCCGLSPDGMKQLVKRVLRIDE